MNLVGKIFTAVIFLMCIVFASFALMVHAAHKQWRDVAFALNAKLDEANKAIDKLQQEKKAVEEARIDDGIKARDNIVKLQNAVQNVADQLKNEVALNVALNHDLRAYTAVVKSVNQNLNARMVEIESVRKDNEVAVNDRQQVFTSLIHKTDDAATAQAEIQRLQVLLRDVAEQNKRLKTLVEFAKLREADMAKDSPAGVTGEITAVPRPDAIEISLGFDDGVRRGNKFAVVRPSNGKYIGDIEVISVNYPNRAVCRPDKSMQRDQFQKGDYVQANLTKRH